MAYTEFRKSYGDFEIVIPAIDFSELNKDEAEKTIEILRRYERNYVCMNLHPMNDQEKARVAIEIKIDRDCEGLEHYIADVMGDAVEECDIYFSPHNLAGKILRKEWCNHMANEIEREHFGHANQTI